MRGIKHLIQCHCILPQYRNTPNPIFHRFVVFSVIDDDDAVVPKVVACNNCGAVHKVTEIWKSSIVIGRDDLQSAMTVEDISLSLPDNVVQVLKSYKVDLPTWEEVLFAFEQDAWGTEIVLTRDTVGELTQGKMLRLIGPPSRIKIESFTRDNLAG